MFAEQITSWIYKFTGAISSMERADIAIVLVAILAIIGILHNRRSIARHKATEASLEKQIETLTSTLSLLNDEKNQLQKELDEQKKKLDFYLNIDADAEILSKNNDDISSTSPKAEAEKKHLDEEQAYICHYMETTSENVFVTGKAGTGKSYLLDAFRGITQKSHIVLAPTGISAINVDGATLHSAFGYYNLVNLDVDSISEETLKLKSEKQSVLRNVKTIIIDEISMVRADVFDRIDRILKVVNKSSLPFGGKQILVFGDLFQLPPVAKGQEHAYLNDRYGGIYFFHSDAYKSGSFKFFELTQNHRQKEDHLYFEILNRIREGQVTDEDIDLLNTRLTQNEDAYDRFVSLFPTKAEAEQVNREHINQLESREFIYQAKILLDKNTNKNKNLESVFPVANELKLKKGASVMMVANDPEHRWVNGTLGIVKDLSPGRIVVSFGAGKVYDIQPLEFDEQEITYSNGKITYEKVFSVMQYPVVPAYAITIHKSQGQTYVNIVCDIEKCFAAGQAYVALSRCASLNGLHLKSKVTLASIKVNREVLDFYKAQQGRKMMVPSLD